MSIFSASLSETNNVLQMIGIFIVFILILVVTYYTTKFVGGVKMGVNKNSNFKVIETYRVTQNKYLQLVQIGTRYVVIAVSKDNISFITELKEDDLIITDNKASQNGNFKDIILSAIKKQKEKNTDDDKKSDHQ